MKAQAKAADASVVSIEPEHLDLPRLCMPPRPDSPPSAEPQGMMTLREAVDRYQLTLVRSTLQRHDGNWAAAARELGLDRGNLRRLAQRLGLSDRSAPV